MNPTQRNLFIGVGGFVVAFIVIGILLLSGGNDDNDGADTAIATNTRSTTAVAAASDGTPTNESSGANPVGTSSSTTESGQDNPTSTSPRVFPTVTPSDPATEETDDGSTDADPTEDTDEDDTEDPTEEPVEPTEEPIIGEFGQLPPIQIVSGGTGRNLDFEYTLDAASFSAPATAPVYQIDWKLWTADDLQSIADNLGVDGEVEDNGADDYQVIGTDSALFAGPTPSGQPIIQYENYAERTDETLPVDSALIDLAYSFLVDSGIVPDTGDGRVVGRDDNAGVAIVEFKPAEPSPLLAALPAASVTFGPGGVVSMADVRWPADYVVSDYGLRATSAMWNDVVAGEASIDADLSELPEGDLSGSFTVTDVGLAYSLAGIDYLAPLVVFYGDAYFSDYDVTVPMRFYVRAVAGQDSPAG